MRPDLELRSHLLALNWNQSVSEYAQEPSRLKRLADPTAQIVRWCKALGLVDAANPAVPFLAEAQAACHYVCALVPLALYRPAAAAMRVAFESVMYYTYFRTHPSELASLVRVPEYYVDKATVLEYHKTHTAAFTRRQSALGLITSLNPWYSRISAIVHGQLPGAWGAHVELSAIGPAPIVLEGALDEFKRAADLVGQLLLCTIDDECWTALARSDKEAFLRGIAGEKKDRLGLPLV